VTKHIKPGLFLFTALLAGLLLLAGCTPVATPAVTTPNATGQAQGTGGFDWTFLVFVVVIIVVFYFLMIRPQRNRQNQQRKMLDQLKVGDHVTTVGGVFGEVDSLEEETVVLKVESGKIRVSRQSIAMVRTLETLG
jgi:preprotein translocase subunit YajC